MRLRLLLPALVGIGSGTALLAARTPGPAPAPPERRPAAGPGATGEARPGEDEADAGRLASWFEAAVRRELETRAAAPTSRAVAAGADPARAASRPRGEAVVPSAFPLHGPPLPPSASPRERAAALAPELVDRADWDYLDDVYEGRISGVPNERRAGIRLEEMVALGPVPYVETLRREGRIGELEDLGLGPKPSKPPAPLAEHAVDDEYRIRFYPLNPRLEPPH